MERKFNILFLIIVFILAVTGCAFAADYDLTFSTSLEEVSTYPANTSFFYPGSNFKKVYTLPTGPTLTDENYEDVDTSKYTLSWDVKAKNASDTWLFWETSKTQLILSGILPEKEGTYSFEFIAKAVLNDGTKVEAEAKDIDIDVYEDTREIIESGDKDGFFADHVTPASGTDLEKITSDYSVTVKFGTRESYFIVSDDYTDIINVPEWLKVEGLTSDDEGNWKSVKISLKAGATIPDGAEATVTVPVTDGSDNIAFRWTVKNIFEPFKLVSDSDLKFTLEAGTSSLDVISFTGAAPKTCKISDKSKSFDQFVSVDCSVSKAKKTISIDVTISDDAEPGDYSATIRFIDERNYSDDLKLTVTVEEASSNGKFSLKGTKTFSLYPGEAHSTILTISGDVSGDVAWAISKTLSPDANIAVEFVTSSDKSADISVRTSNDVAPGLYTVGISVTDEAKISADVELTINIRSRSSEVIPETNPGVVVDGKWEPSKFDFTNETTRQNIADALDVDFDEGEALKTPKELEFISNAGNFFNDFNSKQIIRLPSVRLEEIGVYNLGSIASSDLNDAGFEAGQLIYVLGKRFSSNDIEGDFYSAELDNEGNNFVLVDTAGQLANRVPTSADESLNVVCYIETPGDFDVIVSSTTKGSGSSSSTTTDDTTTPTIYDETLGDSGAGCDSGIASATFLLLVLALLIRKKVK